MRLLEAEHTHSRKRKDPDSCPHPRSQSTAHMAEPATIHLPSTSPQLRSQLPLIAAYDSSSSLSIQSIPPYRGNRARTPSALASICEREKADGEHRRPSDERLTSVDLPLSSKLQPGYSRSAAPLSSREIVPSHRRSPTAPSPATSSSQSSTTLAATAASVAPVIGSEWRAGKENRVDNVAYYRERDRDWEHGAGSAVLAVAGIMPRPSSERARQPTVDHESDRREREGVEYERREHERERERGDYEEKERRARERGWQHRLEQECERGREDVDNAYEHVLPRNQQQVKQQSASVNAERPAPPPPASDQRNALTGASTGPPGAKEKRHLIVSLLLQFPRCKALINLTQVRKKQYMRLECIGRGGSSRVYKAVDESTHKICAIKRVSLERADADTIKGYQNEIQLLLRLKGKPGIIDLIDYESNTRKNFIMLVSVCGSLRSYGSWMMLIWAT